MRGTQTLSSFFCILYRFIPAHAGNTSTLQPQMASKSVHPRACGEHGRGPISHRLESGSSPRMRGTLLGREPADHRDRFIPAHAGNTLTQSLRAALPPVHPRACGEHTLRFRPAPCAGGSSPRMRGTQAANEAELQIDRFIPAHAGNTGQGRAIGGQSTVHPRACGEHSCA